MTASGAHAKRFGRFGEDCASKWYRHAGYRVLDRNWRCRQGELDLVVQRRSEVVFVEVKARSSERFGTGAEAVGLRKQRTLRAVASRWLEANGDRLNDCDHDVRFDVVAVDRRGTLDLYHDCL